MTDQLDEAPRPKQFKDLVAWARNWLSERTLEYPLPTDDETRKKGGFSLPVDQCVDAAMPDMPIRFQDKARRQSLRNAFASIASNDYAMRSIRPGIYGYVQDLEDTLALWQYLRPLRAEVRGRQAAITKLVDVWYEAHPTESMSRDEFLSRLDGDTPPPSSEREAA